MAKDSKNAHLLQNNLQTATDTPPHHKLTTAPSRGYRYTLKLSKDPSFPKVSVHPRFRSVPCTVSSTSSAYVWCKCRALSIRATGRTLPTFTNNRNARHFLRAPVSWSPNIQIKISKNRMSRRRELHPPALVVVAPAHLQACDFSVLQTDWQSECKGHPPQGKNMHFKSWLGLRNAQTSLAKNVSWLGF